MEQVNIHAAKTNLSALVERAASGEPFIIAKAGKPMVAVVPYKEPHPSLPRIGFYKGNFNIPENFDRLMEDEITEMFGV